MTEIDLLKRLVELEQEKHTLEIRIDIWHDDKEIEKFESELVKTETDIKQIEDKLENIDDKSDSRKAKNAMQSQLEAYLTEINKAKAGLKLSRDQGMALENFLFSGILRDLHYYITDEVFGHRIPAYLHYTYSDENSVEIPDLSTFLRAEIINLRRLNNPNYLRLREFYVGFRDRMIERFI